MGRSQKKFDANTKTSAKRDTECRCWFFTWNNYVFDDLCDLETWILEKKPMCVFQEEVGESETPHIQGCFKLKSSIRFSTLKKRFPEVHWEKCKNWEKAIQYCSKSDTRIYGPFYYNMPKPRRDPAVIDVFDSDITHQWQRDIISMMKEKPDGRKIIWLYDESGNIDKWQLVRYLYLKHEGEVLYVTGKALDIEYAVFKFLDNNSNDLKMCIFDYSGKLEKFISYDTTAEIKDGIFFCGGNVCKTKIFNRPHVIVLANSEPDKKALSLDRWDIRNVTDNID